MSFGFGAGDFIAVGELSWKLYRSVYQVARDAPPEIKALHQELSHLSNIVKALNEDASQQDSALAQAPEDRVELGRNLLKTTEDNLRGLEKLIDKYLPLAEPRVDPTSRREAIKRLWAKIQYSGVVREINDYRAKIHYNAGMLNLLLVAAGNSSLQRIQQQNEKLSRNVEAVKVLVQNPSQSQKTPTITCSYDQQSQYELTRTFMEKAEVKGVPWAAIGIESWMQVGKWWLMKAQAGLDGNIQGQCQAYTDLLKASWILTDVISIHPQLSFLSSGQQQLDIEHVSRVVKLEHERLATSGFTRPSVERVMASDLTMWEKDLKTNLLPPIGRAQGRDLAMWKSDSGNVLFQRFGRYVSSSTNAEVECVILLVDKPGGPPTLIGQSAYGTDIVVVEIYFTSCEVADGNDSGWLTLIVKHRQQVHKFRFLNRNDAQIFFLLIDGIARFHSSYKALGLNARTLKAAALLQSLYVRPRDDIILLMHLEETDSEAPGDPGDLWNIAFVISQQPPPQAVQYMSYCRCVTGALSCILWANIPLSTRFAALDTVMPQWRSACVGEAHMAAIISLDLQLLQAVVRCTIVPPGDISPESMDSMESILLRYATNFSLSTHPTVLLLASLILRLPKLVTRSMELGVKKAPQDEFSFIFNQFESIRCYIVTAKDTVACELFLRYAGHFLERIMGPELWFLAQRMCLWTGIKYIALECVRFNECHGWLIPAVIGGDVAFIQALQLHLEDFSANFDPVWASQQRRCTIFPVEICSSLRPRSYIDCDPDGKPISDEGYDQWPYWPLYIAIRLAHETAFIAHLVSTGALLWRETHNQKGEPSILRLIQSFQNLDDAREAYYKFHRKLESVIYFMTGSTKLERTLVSICGEMLGLGHARRRRRFPFWYDFAANESPDLPVSLQTEANFVEWKWKLVSLLEEATAAQLDRPVSEGDSSESEEGSSESE